MIKHFFVILQQCNSASKRLWWNGSLGPKAAIGYDTKKILYRKRNKNRRIAHTREEMEKKKFGKLSLALGAIVSLEEVEEASS